MMKLNRAGLGLALAVSIGFSLVGTASAMDPRDGGLPSQITQQSKGAVFGMRLASPTQAANPGVAMQPGDYQKHVMEMVAAQQRAWFVGGSSNAAPKAAMAETKAAPARQETQVRGARSNYDALIARYAAAEGVPLALAHAVVRVESNYRANARGAAGEVGLMQLKPATARMMGYRGSTKGLYHPETNIKFGMRYLGKAHRLAGGSTCGTILKYNAGHGAKRMNPVSANYCRKVQRYI